MATDRAKSINCKRVFFGLFKTVSISTNIEKSEPNTYSLQIPMTRNDKGVGKPSNSNKIRLSKALFK
jgi:hypothetical protein